MKKIIETMKKRRALSIFILIVIIFALWNVIWLSIIEVNYSKYTNSVPKNWAGVHVKTEDDGFLYSVKKPDYLTYTGNLVIKNTKTGEALFIWPGIFGETIYGLKYIEGDIAYRVHINYEGRMTEDIMEKYNYTSSIKANVEKREEDIKRYFNKAYEMWGNRKQIDN